MGNHSLDLQLIHKGEIMSAFALNSTTNYFPNPNENIMESLFQQYERVIFESIISTFCLDGLIKDQLGGDVDTIHNVRQIGEDSTMTYKNSRNKSLYESREKYDNGAYHRDPRYRNVVNAAKKDFIENGTLIPDTYVKGNTVMPINNKTVPRNRQGQLDHTVSAEFIHNDRGRVLAGIDGMELANNPDNLRYTNAALNNNMRNKSVKEYISWCEANPEQVNWGGKKGEPLPEHVKDKLRKEYTQAQKAYDAKLAHAYYTSPRFWDDTAKAAGKVAALMGVRQVCGFMFTEIWFAVKEKFEKIDSQFDFSKVLKSIGEGIRIGFERAKTKYRDLIQKFADGALAGAMSSITTTLCNIFFTTAKNTVRIIRQTYASLVQAAKILFLNPQNLPFGERMRATAKIVATGASIVVGVLISEALEETGIGKLPIIGELITTFCGTLVTGLMTCSLLYFLDRSELINNLVAFLNNIPSISDEVNYFLKQAEELEKYAAELMKIDLDKFKSEVKAYENAAKNIASAKSEEELYLILKDAFASLDINLPWQGNFNSFMQNKNNRLIFK